MKTELKFLTFKIWITMLTAIALGSVLVGCSEVPYDDANQTYGGFNSSGSAGGAGGTTVVGDDDDFPDNAPEFAFTITGANGTNPVYSTLENQGLFYTNSILRAKITSGPADVLSVPGFPYAATYDCVSYTVTARRYDPIEEMEIAGGWPQSSDILAVQNSVDCTHPQTGTVLSTDDDDVFNFDLLTQGGNPYPFFFEVSTVRTNWRCYMYLAGVWQFQSACNGDGMYPLYETHQATGKLAIQVNGI